MHFDPPSVLTIAPQYPPYYTVVAFLFLSFTSGRFLRNFSYSQSTTANWAALL